MTFVAKLALVFHSSHYFSASSHDTIQPPKKSFSDANGTDARAWGRRTPRSPVARHVPLRRQTNRLRWQRRLRGLTNRRHRRYHQRVPIEWVEWPEKIFAFSSTFPPATEIAIVSYEPDDQVKEKKMITLTQEVIPFYLTKMNVVSKENDGHLVLNRVSARRTIVSSAFINSPLSRLDHLGWHLLRGHHRLLELLDKDWLAWELPISPPGRRERLEQRQHQSLHRKETRHRSIRSDNWQLMCFCTRKKVLFDRESRLLTF